MLFRSWGQYFRPAGVQAPGSTGSTSHTDADEDTPAPKLTVVPSTKPVIAEDPPFDTEDAPVASAPVQAAKPAGQNAQDILAMIRARQAK